MPVEEEIRVLCVAVMALALLQQRIRDERVTQNADATLGSAAFRAVCNGGEDIEVERSCDLTSISPIH
jgi:hypothetical protein